MQTMKITADRNQTVYDIAARWYGTAEAVGQLLVDNPELKNDPIALAACGINVLDNDAFYVDVALCPGTEIEIDTDSKLVRQMVVKQLQNDITTYDNGTND